MKRSKKKTIIFGLLVMLLIAAIIYEVIVPRILSDQYMSNVHAAARPLQSNFKDISESTKLPMISWDDPKAVRVDEAARISALIHEGRKKIALLRTVRNSLMPLPYSDLLGQYKKAEIAREHTRWFIGQSEEALDEYVVVVTYWDTFHKAVSRARAELDTFNNVVDLNAYEGQSESLQQTARKMRTDAALLSQSLSPAEMKTLNAAVVASLNKAAEGFDDLATSLMVPADDPIYEAAQKIESATTDLDAVRGTLYDDSFGQSRVMKNIQELNEKLELVL